jgi:hypothetical protein
MSHTTLHDMLSGRVPSYHTLKQFADRRQLGVATRGTLFVAAGYLEEPSTAIAPTLEDLPAWEMAEKLRQLSPERLDVVRRLVDEPEHLDAVGRLLTARRVIDGADQPGALVLAAG